MLPDAHGLVAPPSCSAEPADFALRLSRQLILVTASDWTSTTAELRCFERKQPRFDWQSIGDPIKVSVGRSGLAWGIGLHGEIGVEGPSKREGDGCAPAGIFAITELFGYADQQSTLAKSAKLPYRSATRDLKCIDDSSSSYYNRIVDQSCLREIDWHSHEDMLRGDACYAVGAVVAHNSHRPLAGAGSCIFIHVWKGEGVPTEGCTAGSFADILQICLWLDEHALPRLVQLPRAEYERLKDLWALPALVAWHTADEPKTAC